MEDSVFEVAPIPEERQRIRGAEERPGLGAMRRYPFGNGLRRRGTVSRARHPPHQEGDQHLTNMTKTSTIKECPFYLTNWEWKFVIFRESANRKDSNCNTTEKKAPRRPATLPQSNVPPRSYRTTPTEYVRDERRRSFCPSRKRPRQHYRTRRIYINATVAWISRWTEKRAGASGSWASVFLIFGRRARRLNSCPDERTYRKRRPS